MGGWAGGRGGPCRGLGVPKQALSAVGAGRQGGGFCVSGLTFISLELHLGHAHLQSPSGPLAALPRVRVKLRRLRYCIPTAPSSKTRGPRQPVPRHHTGNSNYNNVAVACARRQAEV